MSATKVKVTLQYGFTADGGFLIRGSNGWASYAYPNSAIASLAKHSLNLPDLVQREAKYNMEQELRWADFSELARVSMQHAHDTLMIGTVGIIEV